MVQSSAELRERALGAVASQQAKDYAADVTAAQVKQKALSGVADKGGSERRPGVKPAKANALVTRRAGTGGAFQKMGMVANAGGAAASVTRPFNSSAQFVEKGGALPQGGAATAAGTKGGGALAQAGSAGARDGALGTQRAAQKFKLPAGKVVFHPPC